MMDEASIIKSNIVLLEKAKQSILDILNNNDFKVSNYLGPQTVDTINCLVNVIVNTKQYV